MGLAWGGHRGAHRWAGGYARHLVRRALAPRADGPRHLLFAVCDHFEPLWGGADDHRGDARVRRWVAEYPALARYRDADGRPPRHTWFFPGDEYRPAFLDGLAALSRAGLGEVEVHLHHDGDTRASLRAQLEATLRRFGTHGHLSRDGDATRWAFIHGNWSLANGRPDRRWCGVDDELPLLWELGCYADFTFPAAPDPCQPPHVNLVYWPTGDLARRRAHDAAEPARVGAARDDRLLLVTGPLALSLDAGWRPRLENGALTGADPPTAARLRRWVEQGIGVRGRPEWVFVKVHTHGAPERTAASLLGDGGRALHDALAAHYNDGVRWRLHYVTARELYNVARAAMDGRAGDPGAWRDYVVPPPPASP